LGHRSPQPETIALRVLPILLIVTQFLQQRMTPSPGMDPTQQKMMLIMPLFLLCVLLLRFGTGYYTGNWQSRGNPPAGGAESTHAISAVVRLKRASQKEMTLTGN